MNSFEAGNSFREVGARLHEEESRRDRYRTILSFAIALATLLGALVSWSASEALSGAGKADGEGIEAVRNIENASSDAVVVSNLNFANYVAFRRYQRLAEALSFARATEGTTDADKARLTQRIAEANGIADSMRQFLPSGGYVKADQPDSYNLTREIGERTAANQQGDDVADQEHFDEADHLRSKALSLVLILVLTAASLVLFTLAYEARGRARYVWCSPALLVFLIALLDYGRLEIF